MPGLPTGGPQGAATGIPTAGVPGYTSFAGAAFLGSVPLRLPGGRSDVSIFMKPIRVVGTSA